MDKRSPLAYALCTVKQPTSVTISNAKKREIELKMVQNRAFIANSKIKPIDMCINDDRKA